MAKYRENLSQKYFSTEIFPRIFRSVKAPQLASRKPKLKTANLSDKLAKKDIVQNGQ